MVSAAPSAHMVDIGDPPIPQTTSPLVNMSAEEARKNTIVVVMIGLALCAGGWWLWQHQNGFWAVVLGVLGVGLVVASFGPKTLVAACPFCGARMSGFLQNNKSDGKQTQCPKCYEYSVVSGKTLRALDPASSSQGTGFETPVFKDGIWPRACVACGASPTRFDDLTKRNVNALALVLGRVILVKGTLSGVPYCDQHRDALELKVTQSKKMLLEWRSLRMMRRYVAANRSRQPA